MTGFFPIPRSYRSDDVALAEGQTATGARDWIAFAAEDVRVSWRAEDEEGFLPLALGDDYTVAPASPATTWPASPVVTLIEPAETDGVLRIRGARLYERATAVLQGASIVGPALEREFSRIAVTLQEIRRDMDGLGDFDALVAASEQAKAARDAVFSLYLGELAEDPATGYLGAPLAGGEWYVRPDGTQRVYATGGGWGNAPQGPEGGTGDMQQARVKGRAQGSGSGPPQNLDSDALAQILGLMSAAYAEIGDGPNQVPTNSLVAIPSVIQADVRQTVSAGPVDSNGRADFLEAGTGLQVVSKGVGGGNPLHMTWGDGFANGSRRDLAAATEAAFSFSGLPDNQDAIFLYADLDHEAGTLAFGHTLLPPVYSGVRPTSPAAGQIWYPTDHRSRAEVWTGSAWAPTLRLVLGECATNAGVVASVVSYAYRGIYSSDDISGITSSTLTIVNHYIGTSRKLIKIRHYLINISNDAGYTAGDIYHFNMSGDSAGSTSANSGVILRLRNRIASTSINVVIGSSGIRVGNPGTGSWGGITSGNWRYRIEMERGW